MQNKNYEQIRAILNNLEVLEKLNDYHKALGDVFHKLPIEDPLIRELNKYMGSIKRAEFKLIDNEILNGFGLRKNLLKKLEKENAN